MTLFHEHFHQLQYSNPTYYAAVNALNPSHGDRSGGWMLNYPFPYSDKKAQDEFSALSKLLLTAVNATGHTDGALKLAEYLRARPHFQAMLEPDDYKYFSFQLWQEGIARYTEYQVAEFAGANYQPSEDFSALKDFTTFGQLAKAARGRILTQLATEKLGESKREVVYPFGAAEGLLLDTVNPSWRSCYFIDKFDGQVVRSGEMSGMSRTY